LLLGGIFYSVGAVFFAIPKIPYNHAIFHLFVLLGSLSHFIAIYQFVLV
jgi:hemolysin III